MKLQKPRRRYIKPEPVPEAPIELALYGIEGVRKPDPPPPPPEPPTPEISKEEIAAGWTLAEVRAYRAERDRAAGLQGAYEREIPARDRDGVSPAAGNSRSKPEP